MQNCNLIQLQVWYKNQCNGSWEHEFGIRIETLDNPGWNLSIDILGTVLVDKIYIPIKIEENEENWIDCKVSEGKFEGFGGPGNLDQLIRIFLEWAK